MHYTYYLSHHKIWNVGKREAQYIFVCWEVIVHIPTKLTQASNYDAYW